VGLATKNRLAAVGLLDGSKMKKRDRTYYLGLTFRALTDQSAAFQAAA
jgi:hypothetical protein